MPYIIELRDGCYVSCESVNGVIRCEHHGMAKTFQLILDLRRWAKKVGIQRYDIWTDDEQTWCGDHVDTIPEEKRRPGRET